MDETILMLVAVVWVIAFAVAASIIIVRRDGRNFGDFVKQLVIWIGIVSLLPITSWAGATLMHPRTRMQEINREQNRLRDERNALNTREREKAEPEEDLQKKRDRIAKEEERLAKEDTEENRQFNRARFWVAFPVGLITMAAGFFLRPVAVGSGLAFGGLCTLASGCYSFWDDIDDFLRFISLFAVLVILVGIGMTLFRRMENGEKSAA